LSRRCRPGWVNSKIRPCHEGKSRDRLIPEVPMKVVILGAEVRGFQIAKHLIEERKNVVLIEPDPKKAAFAASKLDCLVINGSGNDLSVLKQAGVGDADIFISMTDSDEVNMVACGLVSSEFNVGTKIASIRNLNYIGSEGLSGKILGIDYIVNPEAEVARAIHESIDKGAFSDVITFQKTDLQLHNIKISADSRLADKHVRTIRRYMRKYDFLITAISRDQEVFIPTGDTLIKGGDTLSLITEQKGMAKVFRALGIRKTKIRKVLLVGGSKTARFLLRHFTAQERKHFALVEADSETCKEFQARYPEILIIKSDITDEVLYEDEDIASYDLIVTLTDNDELNILTAIFAKRIGVARGIALVKHNNNYLRLTPHLDIDSTFAMSHSTVNSVLRYIRGGRYASAYSILDGKIEVVELPLEDESPVAGKKIKDIRLKGKALIAAVTRKGKNMIPTGETELAAGDVLLITADRMAFEDVMKIFT